MQELNKTFASCLRSGGLLGRQKEFVHVVAVNGGLCKSFGDDGRLLEFEAEA